jgi:alkylhydroperoxidase family enzyme
MTTESAEPRIDYRKVSPDAIKAISAVERYARFEHRAGSAGACKAASFHDQRLWLLRGHAFQRCSRTWRIRAVPVCRQRLAGSIFHPARARALAWTEAVTEVSISRVPDQVYRLARELFAERELVDLTMAVIAINSWNRLAISFRALAGTYEPAKEHATG